MTIFNFSRLLTSISDRVFLAAPEVRQGRVFTNEEVESLLQAESEREQARSGTPEVRLIVDENSDCLPSLDSGSGNLDSAKPSLPPRIQLAPRTAQRDEDPKCLNDLAGAREDVADPIVFDASCVLPIVSQPTAQGEVEYSQDRHLSERKATTPGPSADGKGVSLATSNHNSGTAASTGSFVKNLQAVYADMARPFPYTYISCPCTESSGPLTLGKRPSDGQQNDEEEGEGTFDPRTPRSNFSLFPPEHLLYCEDCRQIKCPRCITEEIICWFCPSCLFETPTSSVRSDGNRCARNCFNCPICTSPLTVNTLGGGAGGSQQGPWVLACGYCMWTTLDIGIKFDKPTNIRSQLDKVQNGGLPKPSKPNAEAIRQSSLSRDPLSAQSTPASLELSTEAGQPDLDHESRFAALKGFYKDQIAETAPSPNVQSLIPSSDYAYASPSNLNRIMNLYTGLGIYGKKLKTKPPLMREALSPSEGLLLPSQNASPDIEKMQATGWEGLTSIEQRRAQASGEVVRFVDDLRPQPVLLRTKRSKRCKACKHILVKPEFKPQSTRFRINLLVFTHVPLVTLRPLIPAGSPASSVDLECIEPLKPAQFLLTLKNHIFDPVKVSLATPAKTPGRWGTRVTVLCPVFDIGANSDVWDDALNPGSKNAAPGGEGGAEAGKVWEKGRNWTTVVLEVVPSLIEGAFEEDEDVLEIPIFVRQEWKETAADDSRQKQEAGKDGEEDSRRELAYWMVLGVGRIKVEA